MDKKLPIEQILPEWEKDNSAIAVKTPVQMRLVYKTLKLMGVQMHANNVSEKECLNYFDKNYRNVVAGHGETCFQLSKQTRKHTLGAFEFILRAKELFPDLFEDFEFEIF